MGRKPSLTEQEIESLVNSLVPPKILAKLFGVSLGTIYRYIRMRKRVQTNTQGTESK